MKSPKTTLTLILAVIAAAGSLMTAVYSYNLSCRIEQVARASRADLNYLRGCIRGLEAELTASILDRLEAIARPVDGPASDETLPDETALETTLETASETTLETRPDNTPVILPETCPDSLPETIIETVPETYPITLPETQPQITKPDTDPDTYPETSPETIPETIPETVPETAPETVPVELPTHNRPESTPYPTPVLFTIAAHEGRIGVFDATGRLIRTVNVFLFALPESDRQALTVGIPAYSKEEMVAIVSRYE